MERSITSLCSAAADGARAKDPEQCNSQQPQIGFQSHPRIIAAAFLPSASVEVTLPHMTQTQGTPTTTPARPATTVIPDQHGGVITRFFGFIGWVFTGFGLLGVLRRRHSASIKSDEIILHSVHRAFFLWFLILTGFVGRILRPPHRSRPRCLGLDLYFRSARHARLDPF